MPRSAEPSPTAPPGSRFQATGPRERGSLPHPPRRGRAEAGPPPSGTYEPSLASPKAGPVGGPTIVARGAAGPPGASPAARRYLAEAVELLARATVLLQQHAAHLDAEVGTAQATAPGEGPDAAAAHAAVEAATPEEARLAAVELAVAGLTRARVGERLVAQHGVRDPEALLDEVFGTGTTPAHRLYGRP
jgi:hypothetical protein